MDDDNYMLRGCRNWPDEDIERYREAKHKAINDIDNWNDLQEIKSENRFIIVCVAFGLVICLGLALGVIL